MLTFDRDGMCVNPTVRLARRPALERAPMTAVRGIIVHQTNGPTAQSALNGYSQASANGAHFLIDRDGTIYQTASILRVTHHVGKLKARCLVEHRCTPTEIKAARTWNPAAMNQREMAKSVPARYPSNADSIGIEIVGEAFPRGDAVPDKLKTYEAVSPAQNASLRWLAQELTSTLGVPMTEVHRHPTVSWKNKTEASTAQW